jgi:hypothetical protein
MPSAVRENRRGFFFSFASKAKGFSFSPRKHFRTFLCFVSFGDERNKKAL